MFKYRDVFGCERRLHVVLRSWKLGNTTEY